MSAHTNTTLRERFTVAIEKDPGCIISSKELQTHPGRTTAEMLALGFKEADLRKLERKGLALKGYLPRKEGHQVRWFLYVG